MRWPRRHSVQPRSCPTPSLPRTSGGCSSPNPRPRLSQAWQTTAKSVAEPRRTIVCSNNFSHLPIGLRRRCQVRELRVPLEERELECVGGTVAVLGQDHLGNPLLIALVVVVLVAIDTKD